MEAVEMDTCSRCKESWFAMDLRDTVCHTCYLRDKRGQSPSLMSSDNGMDPGDVPAHLGTSVPWVSVSLFWSYEVLSSSDFLPKVLAFSLF
jgi:hypothetical protein